MISRIAISSLAASSVTAVNLAAQAHTQAGAQTEAEGVKYVATLAWDGFNEATGWVDDNIIDPTVGALAGFVGLDDELDETELADELAADDIDDELSGSGDELSQDLGDLGLDDEI